MILLSGAFRLFFPAAGAVAALALPLWLLLFYGQVDLIEDPLAWHMHEMLYGYLPAALAGFLLTAIPNWTKRPPVSGTPLLALFLLWLAGRVGMFVSPASLAAHLLTFGFLPVLAALAGREIVVAGNRRNLVVIALMLLLAGAHGVFLFVSSDVGLTLGFGTALILITLIGGRVTPAFCRNWLIKNGASTLPAPFGSVDKAAMMLTVATIALWALAPDHVITGLIAVAAAFAMMLRLARWRGLAVASEPLLLSLHVSYLWIPVALALLALATLTDTTSISQVRHAIGAGAIGGMTMIVMQRALLGHTGRTHVGTPIDWVMLFSVHLGAVLRVIAGWVGDPMWIFTLAGGLWALGFAIFTLRALPIVVAPRQ